MTEGAPWSGSFIVGGQPGGAIELHQVNRKTFLLSSTIRYVGEKTGLEGKIGDVTIEQIRGITPEELPATDLASVPGPFRWFVGR